MRIAFYCFATSFLVSTLFAAPFLTQERTERDLDKAKIQIASDLKKREEEDAKALHDAVDKAKIDQRLTDIETTKAQGYGNTASSPAPQIEGVTWVSRSIPSPDNSKPYALELTIQVQAEIANFGIAIYCDDKVTGNFHRSTPNGMDALMGVQSGGMNNAPETSYGVKIAMPTMVPQIPMIIVLTSEHPIHISQVVRW